jgi:hypothetical protein
MVTTNQTGRLFANTPTHKNLLQRLSLPLDHNGLFTPEGAFKAGRNMWYVTVVVASN